MNGGPATFDYRRVCKITKWPQSVGPKTFELNPCSYYSTGRFTKEKVLSKKSNLLRILMDFVGCFSSFEGNQWLNSSKFWNKCVRYSVEVCHRLRLSTISLPFSLVWALCSGYPATHVGPDKTDWYTFRNIPTSNVPVGINWCQPFWRTTLPVPFQGAVWKMYHLNPPHKPLTKQPNFSASWFCLVRTYNSVSKCGLKAGDYSGDIFWGPWLPPSDEHHDHHVASKKKRFKSSAISSGCSWFASPAAAKSLVSPFYASLSLSLTPSPFYAGVIKCDS